MNSESLGKKFKKGKDIYECIAYTDKPTVIMKNIETNEKINVVIDSMFANDFVEITNKIQKLEKLGEIADIDGDIAYSWSRTEAKLKTKINEIIDKINNMEEIYGRK